MFVEPDDTQYKGGPVILSSLPPLQSSNSLSPSSVPAHKSYTVAIIKPDVVAHGKASEIIMKVRAARLLKQQQNNRHTAHTHI